MLDSLAPHMTCLQDMQRTRSMTPANLRSCGWASHQQQQQQQQQRAAHLGPQLRRLLRLLRLGSGALLGQSLLQLSQLGGGGGGGAAVSGCCAA
jgi:hypothetical protein